MFALAQLDFTWRATRALRLPEYPGSAWRGAFGHALRKTACLTGAASCDGCPLRQQCAYIEILETPPSGDAGFLSQYREAPHPYVIAPAPGGRLAAGQTHATRVTLIGRSVRHAGLVRSVMQAAARTLDHQGTLECQDYRIQPFGHIPAPPPVPGAVCVHFETPLRLRVDNHYWKPADFRFAPFFSALLRRLVQLAAVHGGEVPAVDPRALVDAAGRVQLGTHELNWKPLERYSSRQQRKVPMGGIVGRVDITGELEPLWPWLWAGQWTHVGKGTVMGLGRYRIEPLT